MRRGEGRHGRKGGKAGAGEEQWDVIHVGAAAKEIHEELLSQLGGKRVVHGHSVIADQVGVHPVELDAPHLYAGGKAPGIDAGLFALSSTRGRAGAPAGDLCATPSDGAARTPAATLMKVRRSGVRVMRAGVQS